MSTSVAIVTCASQGIAVVPQSASHRTFHRLYRRHATVQSRQDGGCGWVKEEGAEPRVIDYRPFRATAAKKRDRKRSFRRETKK